MDIQAIQICRGGSENDPDGVVLVKIQDSNCKWHILGEERLAGNFSTIWSLDRNPQKRVSDVPVIKYYKEKCGMITGVTPGHESGSYTMLHSRTPEYTWIRSRDLYDTREEADRAEPAVYADINKPIGE